MSKSNSTKRKFGCISYYAKLGQQSIKPTSEFYETFRSEAPLPNARKKQLFSTAREEQVRLTENGAAKLLSYEPRSNRRPLDPQSF